MSDLRRLLSRTAKSGVQTARLRRSVRGLRVLPGAAKAFRIVNWSRNKPYLNAIARYWFNCGMPCGHKATNRGCDQKRNTHTGKRNHEMHRQVGTSFMPRACWLSRG